MEAIKNLFDRIVTIYSQSPRLFIYTIILGLLCILLKIYYPKFRGLMGEFWVKLELKKLPKNKYIVLNDIMIKDQNGTHQIDHIILSNYGIFVIEMKNYYGLIKGKEQDNKWCQYLGKFKNRFMNPIHQNYGHIKALSNMLKIDGKHFISMICFSNQAKVIVNCKTTVTQLDYLINEIKKHNEIILDINIEEIKNSILSNNITNKKIRKQHIKNIHSQLRIKEELANRMICPKCGGELVKKNGKYGKFIGCSNFPKCKYTRN